MSGLRRWSEEGARAEEMLLLDVSRRVRAGARARARTLEALGVTAAVSTAMTGSAVRSLERFAMNRDEHDRSRTTAISRLGVLRLNERSDAQGSPKVRTPAADAEFKAIYDKNFNLVWRALARYGVPDSDMMDVTQKVFLTAFLKLPDFEGRSRLSTWLWGIARRVASSYRRAATVQNEVPTDPGELEVATESVVESDSPRQLAAERMLAKMPEAQRVVFLLFEVDEMDGADIAALLDVPLGTVRSRLRYARETFRREARRMDAAHHSTAPKELSELGTRDRDSAL